MRAGPVLGTVKLYCNDPYKVFQPLQHHSALPSQCDAEIETVDRYKHHHFLKAQFTVLKFSDE